MAGNGVKFRGRPREQLEAFTVRNEISGCWIWIGGIFNQTGYGQFNNLEISKSPTTAHRAAWQILRGPIPKRLMVLHKCDNRRCINPDHLYLGNNSDNMRDRSLRGYVHQRKLSEDNVREMRKLRQNGMSWRKLATKYGVAMNAVRQATLGESWAFVDTPIPTIKIGPGRR